MILDRSIVTGLKSFGLERLEPGHLRVLEAMATRARADALTMCTNAGSGHPGGSLSSIDLSLMLWLCLDAIPDDGNELARDRIVISHGHTAAGVYAVLAQIGLVERLAALEGFRKAGSIFEGHPGLKVPGIDWASGNLGQGLSAGCGFALAARLHDMQARGTQARTAVLMGDGEQQKGQIAEAARFAAKYRLGNLLAVIDCNGLQAMGTTAEIMPQRIAEEYKAFGWRVFEADGHDFQELYATMREACRAKEQPAVILARTVMGKGVSFIENHYEYHGRILNREQLELALCELKHDSNSSRSLPLEATFELIPDKLALAAQGRFRRKQPTIIAGTPRNYAPADSLDCRTAFGRALCDLADLNNDRGAMAVLDCDLAESVKTAEFARKHPDRFIQCGIAEHNAVTVAGALSKSGVLTFLADFAIFGICETYNQQRLNDINQTSLKLILTHCGLDVGEDGKTHQCMDVVGSFAGLHHFKLLIPADPNQADRMTRYAATYEGNIALAMGRSKVPILCDETGAPLFGADYVFEYGRADWIRHGGAGTIITCGGMVHRALDARQALEREGLNVGILNITSPLELDLPALREAASTGLIVTYEDHNIQSGLGAVVGARLMELGLSCRFIRLGAKEYGQSGAPEELYRIQGLSVADLVRAIKQTTNESVANRGDASC